MNPRKFRLFSLCTALALCALPLALLPGCKSGSTPAGGTTTASPTPSAASYVTPASVQLAAQLAATSALSFGVQDAGQRKLVADDCYAAAHALRTLATGQAPTVQQIQDTVKQFGGPSIPPAYQALASNLSALYAQFYPALIAKGDPAANAKTVAYLEALAEGVEAGAAPYE